MRTTKETYDVVVCGGGLAGLCAAIRAARAGAKACLVHNRPVLGGNSSSEVGVTPHGAAAFHAYARETGIISELLIEERAQNHAEIYENGWTNSVWDMVMYDAAVAEPNLALHLNTDVVDVVMAGDAGPRGLHEAAESAGLKLGYYHRPSRNTSADARIAEVIARVASAETELVLSGKIFIDCTGDALVADRAGCEWRMGSESRDEFGEPHAPAKASTDVMGNSIHFRCRDIGRPAPFRAPAWAVQHTDASFFYDQGRLPKEERGGFWWLEIGVPHHTIHDNETIRHELTRHALGVWDWMKNRDPIMRQRTQNYALEWIGQVPGKRESRRVIGEYFLTEHDVQKKTVFEDEVAFGGWFVDLHTPGGLLAGSSEPTSADGCYDTFADYAVMSYCGPYGIPLRSLIARDVKNLMMAGRNISATHAALGTARVMGTTALMGEAAGLAAAVACRDGVTPAETATGQRISEIRQRLLRGGCFLPSATNTDAADLARQATASASSSAPLTGAGPHTAGVHTGLKIWKDQPQYQHQQMTHRKGQMIAIGSTVDGGGDDGGGGRIDSLRVCLTNHTSEPQTIETELLAVDHIWDYRIESAKTLARGSVVVPPAQRGDGMHWATWRVQLDAKDLPAGGYVRLDLLPNPNVAWHVAGCVVPGQLGVYQIGPDKMRRFGNGETLSFQVDPPQHAFGPEQALTGVTRPHRSTNLWRSDPAQPLPQWLGLTWDEPQTIDTIELTFPGHLLREYHAYGPNYADAQCPRRYTIEALEGDPGDNDTGRQCWRQVAVCDGNHHRRRVHTLDEPVTARAVRVVVHETNGDPSAAIFEIRCYTTDR